MGRTADSNPPPSALAHCDMRWSDCRRQTSGVLTSQSAPAGLKKFLKKNVDAETDTLAVLDAKLGGIVKDKMGIQCINK